MSLVLFLVKLLWNSSHFYRELLFNYINLLFLSPIVHAPLIWYAYRIVTVAQPAQLFTLPYIGWMALGYSKIQTIFRLRLDRTIQCCCASCMSDYSTWFTNCWFSQIAPSLIHWLNWRKIHEKMKLIESTQTQKKKKKRFAECFLFVSIEFECTERSVGMSTLYLRVPECNINSLMMFRLDIRYAYTYTAQIYVCILSH